VILKNQKKPRSPVVFSNSSFFKTFKKVSSKKLLLVFFGCLVMLPPFFLSAIYIKAWISPGHLTQFHKENIQWGYYSYVKRWIASYFPSIVDIPSLHVDIKFKNFQKLTQTRDEALKQGRLEATGPESYVSGKIRYKDKTLKVKLRLKGDGLDHLRGDKWSLRVKVREGDAFFGMRKFSIQDPVARQYEKEVLFYEALEREGLMTHRYFFVNVFINGQDIGLMAVEEHPSKELIESQGRRDGPILKLIDSPTRIADALYWRAIYTSYPLLAKVFVQHRLAQIALVGANLESQSESFRSQYRTAVGLMRGFVEGKLSVSQVFDPDSTGRYIALAKVWAAEHSLNFGNARFYFNPLTAKFEIIGHDANIEILNPIFNPDNSLIMRMLEDEKVRSVYSKTLRRLDKEFREGVTLEWAQKIQKENLKILHREFFRIRGLDLNEIKERASRLVKMDKELFRSYPDYLRVYYIKDPDGKDVLEIINTLPNPVVVTSIKAVDRLTGKTHVVKPNVPSHLPFTLNSSPIGFNPQVQKVALGKAYDIGESNIQVYSNIRGDDETRVYDAAPYHPALNDIPIPSLSIEQILSRFPFISQVSPGTLSIKQGKWNISDWLSIPAGTKLIIPKGTVLLFNSLAGLVARGPILIDGTVDEPVVLRGSGQEEGNRSWQGVFISTTEEASVWSNVTILDTTGLSKNGWNLSAGVTFYQADAELKNVSFLGNLSEDALNIVRSNFKLEGVSIKNALSDGFDSDFSSGFVKKGRFENIGSAGGGDAIDVSGTTIDISEATFKNIQDKAVSVGENSTVTATQLLIKSVGVGVVSKDGSRLSLADSEISDFQTAAMMAYQKKKQYGPGTISAENLKIQNLPASALVQKGSEILIDGVALPAVDLNVKNLYATTMKPGLK